MPEEILDILRDAHKGPIRGHNLGEIIIRKVLLSRLWWPIVFKDAYFWVNICDIFSVSR